MDFLHYSIPISLLRQYQFCPRIPFFQEYRGITPESKVWQNQGLTFHQRQEMLTRRRTIQRFGLPQGRIEYNVDLQSQRFGIHGVADGIIYSKDKYFPIEFKLDGSKPSKGHCLQLAAYGMVIAEKYNKSCEQGFILYGDKGKTHIIEIKKWRDMVLDTIAKINLTLSNPVMPYSSATEHQCVQCEYINFCGDRY